MRSGRRSIVERKDDAGQGEGPIGVGRAAAVPWLVACTRLGVALTPITLEPFDPVLADALMANVDPEPTKPVLIVEDLPAVAGEVISREPGALTNQVDSRRIRASSSCFV